MKKTKKNIPSTDYFFEALYQKAKTFLYSNVPSKIISIKVLTLVSWFRDIN
jgi:hypothetical protein